MSLTNEQVLEALKRVIHPESRKNVVELGMVENLQIDGNEVFFALRFALIFDPSVKVSDMETLELSGTKALYWETTLPSDSIRWRQWVFFANGRCFTIVSSIELDKESGIWPDVKNMVESFKVVVPKE